ncbi:MAG: PD40 domain-containing protein [Bryobacterales bacterium]|nr:PD40 domain-containing protein [Bryobacterales bacterium]
MLPAPESPLLFRFGSFELDGESGELRKQGVRLKLQPQPAQILKQLLLNAGKVVTRDEIRAGVWGAETFVDFEHGLNNAIKKIREVLNDSSDEPRYIETLPKVGYRFLAEVESVYPRETHKPSPVAVMPQPQFEEVRKESKTRGRNLRWAAVAAAGVAAIGFAIWLPASRDKIGEPVRFSLALPENLKFADVGFSGSPVAFSPDGSEIVVVAREGKTVRLYRRKLRDPQFESVAGSESARAPVYSADGKSLVFADINERQLKRLPVGGGIAEKLHGVNLTFFGIHQSTDGRLWFGDCGSGLMCRRADGSTDRLTNVTSDGNELGAVDREHSFPEVLPGGTKLIYSAWTSNEASALQGLDLASRIRKPLIRPGVAARYLPRTKHLVYAWQGNLYSVPFDADGLNVKGEPSKVMEGVAQETQWGASFYAVSANGHLAYIQGAPQHPVGPRAWVNWKGEIDRSSPLPHFLNNPRISPDGRQISYFEAAGPEGGVAIWVYDIASGVRRRLTGRHGNAYWSAWMPDNRELVISADFDRSGSFSLYRIRADGGGEPQRLTSGAKLEIAGSVSPDGKWLLFASQKKSGAKIELRLLDLRTPGAGSTRFGNSDQEEFMPDFSPDGRWVATVTNALSKEKNVVIRPFANPGRAWKVSEGGGWEPIWSRDGKRLYFRSPSGGRLLCVEIDLSSDIPGIGPQRKLFEGPFFPSPFAGRVWDLHPDGKRLLLATFAEKQPRGRAVEIVLNWDGTLPGRQ